LGELNKTSGLDLKSPFITNLKLLIVIKPFHWTLTWTVTVRVKLRLSHSLSLCECQCVKTAVSVSHLVRFRVNLWIKYQFKAVLHLGKDIIIIIITELDNVTF